MALNDYLACILRAANEMVSNINMFRSPLVDWVLGQGDCTLVVLKNQNKATYLTNVLHYLSEIDIYLLGLLLPERYTQLHMMIEPLLVVSLISKK